MKSFFTILFIQILFLSFSYGQKLKISENNRYLITDDGKAFFYLGDTAWELFHRLTLNEARAYLINRADKGFTVIQAVILAQLDGLTVPNANGDIPLINNDPLQPNEPYFRHVDDIVQIADSLGLYVGMLPCWGSYWSGVNSNKVIFQPSNAKSFGEFLGRRYRDQRIIWILGGDENINDDHERKIIENMVTGLKNGDKGSHLCTFHPRGPGQSSTFFHETGWLDFNMSQSSHAARGHDNGIYTASDLQLSPPKPTLDGEPRYELIPVGFYFFGSNQLDLFNDSDVRQAAYLSLLSGACGHTYGHNSVWQMYTRERRPVIGAKIPWNKALDHPGAFQMTHFRTLFESRPFYKLIPQSSMISDGPSYGGGKIKAAIADDHSFAIIYSPEGSPFTIDQSRIKARKLKAIWFDPRYGISYPFAEGNTFSFQTYTPPTNGKGNDWILIIEAEEKNYPLPGPKI